MAQTANGQAGTGEGLAVHDVRGQSELAPHGPDLAADGPPLERVHTLVRVLGKEASVGIVNGLVLGLILGGLAFAWKGNPWLGLCAAILAGMLIFAILVLGPTAAAAMEPMAVVKDPIDAVIVILNDPQ